MKKLFSLVVLTVCIGFASYAQYQYPFQDPNLSMEERINDLVSRLTVQEKIDQLIDEAPSVPGLGIPEYQLVERRSAWCRQGRICHGVSSIHIYGRCPGKRRMLVK